MELSSMKITDCVSTVSTCYFILYKKLPHFETNHQLHKRDEIVEPFCCKILNMGVGAPSLFLDKYTQF